MFEFNVNSLYVADNSHEIYRGSYISAHVSLILLNKLRKRDKNSRLAKHFISFSQ